MTVEELKNSGLLELYVLGDLTQTERDQVEGMLGEHPGLKKDLFEIQTAFGAYAKIKAIDPPQDLKAKVLQGVSSTDSKVPPLSSKSNGSNWLGMILASIIALGALIWAWSIYQQNQQLSSDYQRLQAICDSTEQSQSVLLATYERVLEESDLIVPIQPTTGYPATDLVLFSNTEGNRNYLQLRNLPPITGQQAYQLWSLKPNQAPIPLTVFTAQTDIVEVDFEQGTQTYAITIEPAGGSQSPTLSQLIGTMAVSG